MKVVMAQSFGTQYLWVFHKRQLRRETNTVRHRTADQRLTNIQQALQSIN